MSKPRQLDNAKDKIKENVFKELSGVLQKAGVRVRREKLKSGPGWKAVSGGCRVESQHVLFVDPRMPQDDQILFLRSRVQQLGLDASAQVKEAEVDSVASSAGQVSPAS